MEMLVKKLKEYGLNPMVVENEDQLYNTIDWIKLEKIAGDKKLDPEQRKKQLLNAIGISLFVYGPSFHIEDLSKFREKFTLSENILKIPEKIMEEMKFGYNFERQTMEIFSPGKSLVPRTIMNLYSKDDTAPHLRKLETYYVGEVKEIVDRLVPEYKLKRVFNPEQAEEDARVKMLEMEEEIRKEIRSKSYDVFLFELLKTSLEDKKKRMDEIIGIFEEKAVLINE